MTDRVARVRVVADTSAYQKSMQAAAGSTDTLIKKAGGLDAIGGKMQALGGSMTRALTLPLGAAVGLAVKSASDLQQAVGGTEAVFGDAADAINDYAKTAASASGLSEREFREATTSIGGQLKRMTGDVDLAAEQSMKLTGVAADLAATYGGTTADAVAALGSAFRGEADPAERFNLNLKIGAVNAKAVAMGLAESETEVNDNAKAQATLALIMEQSADATGQFARESDSAAGSMQIAKAEMENASAEIGSALLPLVADLAGGVADLAGSFSKLPEPVQNGVLAIAGLLAVSGPLLSLGGNVLKSWNAISTGFDKAATSAFDLSGKLNLVKLGAVAVAAVAVGAALNAWRTEMNEAKSDAEDFVDAFTRGSVRPVESMRELENEIMRVGAAAAEMKRRGDEAINPFLKDRLREAESGLNDTRDALLGASSAASELQADLGISADEAARMATNQDLMAAATDEATGELDTNAAAAEEQAKAVEAAEEAQKEFEESIRRVTDAMRSQLDPLFAAQDAFADHRDLQDELKWANLDLVDSGADLAAAIQNHGRKSDEAAAAWHRQLEAQKKVDDLNDQVTRSALDVATAAVELKARVDDGSVSLEAAESQLRDWVAQGLITADQAYATAEQLRGTASAADSLSGRNIVIPVSANTTAFEMQMRALYDGWGRAPGIRISAGGGGGLTLASGGPVPGSPTTAVPATLHGGEYVLSADVVRAIKEGRPSSGLTAMAPVAGGGSSIDQSRTVGEVHNHFYGHDGPDPIAAIAWAVA